MNLRSYGPGRLERVQRGDGAPRWTLTWTDAAGKRQRRGLSTDKRVAERIRSELIQKRDLELAGLGGEARMDRPLRELVDAYLGDLATRACPRHVLNTRLGLRDLLARIPAIRVCDLRPVMLVEYRAKLLAKGLSVRTANLAADRLRAALNWAVQLELLARNPIERLPRLRETEATQRHRRRAMSEQEIGAFLAAAQADDQAIAGEGSLRGVPRVPQHPLWRAFLECGCRYGELVAVRWADLDLDARVVTLRATTTKAGKSRQIPLLPGLAAELGALRDAQVRVLRRPLRPDDRVFLSPRGCHMQAPTNNAMRTFDRLLEAAGIDRVDAQGRKLDVHALRHTLATRLARSGAALVHAQQILGHSDPKLTARVYQHLCVEDLRPAMAAMDGRPLRAVAQDGTASGSANVAKRSPPDHHALAG